MHSVYRVRTGPGKRWRGHPLRDPRVLVYLLRVAVVDELVPSVRGSGTTSALTELEGANVNGAVAGSRWPSVRAASRLPR